MSRQNFLDAIAKLPESEFRHLVAVIGDIAKRLPGHEFSDLATVAAQYSPEVIQNSDVTVGLSGVSATAEKGGVG